MIKKKQINKGTVKDQTNKSDTKKKAVSKDVVWECLICGRKEINNEKPTICSCSNGNFVVNNSYTVKE